MTRRSRGRSSRFSNAAPWTDDIFKLFSWDVAAHERAILAAWEELDAYLDDMVAHRRQTLSDDLISALIRAEDDGDRLSAAERRITGSLILSPSRQREMAEVVGAHVGLEAVGGAGERQTEHAGVVHQHVNGVD